MWNFAVYVFCPPILRTRCPRSPRNLAQWRPTHQLARPSSYPQPDFLRILTDPFSGSLAREDQPELQQIRE